MRLGGIVFADPRDPERFAQAHAEKGFTAAVWPQELDNADPLLQKACARALAQRDIVLAQVGVWRNCLDRDPVKAEENIQYAIHQLQLAEELGAVTCMNIAGSMCAESWDGPDPENYTAGFREAAVDTVRRILDAVRPTRTTFSLEMLPYCFLDSPQAYLDFLRDVDRPGTAVHFDPINCLSSPRRLIENRSFLDESFRLLGDRIVCMHLKDLRLRPHGATVCMEEAMIGEGWVDIGNILCHASRLPENIPVILEHYKTESEFDCARAAVWDCASRIGVSFYKRKR